MEGEIILDVSTLPVSLSPKYLITFLNQNWGETDIGARVQNPLYNLLLLFSITNTYVF